MVDLAESPLDETQWFTMRLRVERKRIQVWLNDKPVVDYTEPSDVERDPSRSGRRVRAEGGGIALQAHDPGSVFHFLSIRVLRLP